MHMQIRVKIPRQSPPSVTTLLGFLAERGVNLAGAGGSNVEFDGEFAFAPHHGHEDAAIATLDEKQYEYRVFVEHQHPELKVCYLTDDPGQLHGCVQEAEVENLARKRGIRDILIGAPTSEGIPVQIFSESNGEGSED